MTDALPEIHPAPAPRLSDEVYDLLLEAIVSGQLAPGARIRDAEVAQRFGISRMPVREALQRLERLGLVEMVASRYTRVTDVTAEAIRDSLEYVGYLAGVGLRLAVLRMTASDRAIAADLVLGVVHAIELNGRDSPFPLIYDAAAELHRFTAQHSGNQALSVAFDEAWVALRRNLRGARPAPAPSHELREGFLQLHAALRRDASPDEVERVLRSTLGLAMPPYAAGA